MEDTRYAKTLHEQLLNAGIEFSEVGQNGIVYGVVEIQDRPDVKAVIDTLDGETKEGKEYAEVLHEQLVRADIAFRSVGQDGIVYGIGEIQDKPEIRAIAESIGDPLENMRGKSIRNLEAKEMALLLEWVCDRIGVSVDGVIQ